MNLPLEPILFGFLIVTALMVAVETNLFAAAMLTGIFSLISACLFVLMDAVDVAFTEASVGAGISTVLVLGTLALTGRKEDQQPARMFPFIVCLLVGAVLVVGTLGMPRYGAPDAPIHKGTAKNFFDREFPSAQAQSPAAKKEAAHGASHQKEGQRAIGLQNIVTSILASYRGYDTLGETAVIFTAGVGVMLLLVGRRRRDFDASDTSSKGPSDSDAHPGESEEDLVLLDEDEIVEVTEVVSVAHTSVPSSPPAVPGVKGPVLKPKESGEVESDQDEPKVSSDDDTEVRS